MRTATTAEPIAHAILELEAQLRPAVFTSVWGPSSQVQLRPAGAGAPARKGPAGRKPTPKPGKVPATSISKSGRLNRAASAASGETTVLPIMYNKHGEINTKKVVTFKMQGCSARIWPPLPYALYSVIFPALCFTQRSYKMPVMQNTSDCLWVGGSQIKHLQHSRPVWDMSLAEGVNTIL